MLLSCVCSVNSIKFPSKVFGVSYHTASSEPWFYDTAYKVVKHQRAIPVDDVLGVCFIAKPVKGGDLRFPEHKCGAKIHHVYKMEVYCRMKTPTDEQVSFIAVTKLLFRKPTQRIKRSV